MCTISISNVHYQCIISILRTCTLTSIVEHVSNDGRPFEYFKWMTTEYNLLTNNSIRIDTED